MRNLIYILPAVMVLAIVEVRTAEIKSLYALKSDLLVRRAAELELLVLGGCDAQSAIAPAEWTVPGVNLATANQSLVVSSQLFTRWVDRLPKLRTLVLSTSYFAWKSTLSSGSAEYWRNYFFMRHFGVRGELSLGRVLDIRTFSLFFLHWPYSRDFLLGRKLPMGGTLHPIEMERFPVWRELREDGYVAFPAATVEQWKEASVRRTVDSMHRELREDVVEQNLRAVRQIAKRASEAKVDLYFLRTPVHPAFGSNMNDSFNQWEDGILEQLRKEFGARILDYRYSRQFIEEDFSDPQHLNPGGARKLALLMADSAPESFRIRY